MRQHDERVLLARAHRCLTTASPLPRQGGLSVRGEESVGGHRAASGGAIIGSGLRYAPHSRVTTLE